MNKTLVAILGSSKSWVCSREHLKYKSKFQMEVNSPIFPRSQHTSNQWHFWNGEGDREPGGNSWVEMKALQKKAKAMSPLLGASHS